MSGQDGAYSRVQLERRAMVDKSKLKDVLERLVTALSELRRSTGQTATAGTLHPPASGDEIAAFEKRSGFKCPPSYRSFLQMHNGWEKYRRVWTLIGAGGDHATKALQQVERDFKIFVVKWEQKYGKATPQKIQEFEAKFDRRATTEAAAYIYLPNHFAFGTDFAGSLYVFDRRHVAPDGENEVFERDASGDITWHKTFVAMLEAHLASTEERLKQ